ncbi:hypothetical protein MKP05_20305 [Halomonas sp. EGI 63088]|uniref:Deoxynucleoside kinase domain-containing protein n=1 Tax=Halomonas flagellata TaxID=2920385 RepID=A0ABS9S042_9GAMM|nr:hypothetical protein [Halomonas flagellata]MCH4565444.1 hypothetical protein [Halomonas flagellata]
MPYIIEFIGVPGSGKTFSSLKLESLLRSEASKVISYAEFSSGDVNFFRIIKKMISTFKFMIRSPREFIGLGSLIFSNEYKSKLIVWSILINYSHLLDFLNKCRYESLPAVVEQGIFQIGWPLIYYSTDKEPSLKVFYRLIDNAIKHIDPSLYILVCIAPPEIVLAKRMRKRNLSDLNIRESMASLELLYSSIKGLRSVSGMIFLSNDGSDSSNERTNTIILDLVKSNGQKKNHYHCDK